jgi:tetrahydromethanopterin S-methyltransferase subunit G
MIILLSGIFLVGIGLTIYAFLPGRQNPEQKKADELGMHLSAQAAEPTAAYLIAEIGQLKSENKNLQADLEVARNIEKGLREELAKSTAVGGAENLDRLNKENAQLREELLAKTQELAIVTVQATNLNRGLGQDKEKSEYLLNENRQLLEKTAALKEQVEAYKKETDRQKEAIPEQRPLGEAVPKKDYDELNNRLSEQTNKLEAVNKENADFANEVKLLQTQIAEYKKEEAALKLTLQSYESKGGSENTDAVNKIKMLEQQIEQYKKEIDRLSAAQGHGLPEAPTQDYVPRQEYEGLKKKLEEAEEILKIVHGTGE